MNGVFYEEERIVLFIDGSNFYAAGKALGFDIDYQRVLDFFNGQARLIRANYYTAILDTMEHDPMRGLYDWLGYNGYNMVTKPVKVFNDQSGRKLKGNLDVELAVQMLQMAQKRVMDHAVLFSGDGDFESLVEAVQMEGVRVTVVSTMQTQPKMVADALRRRADNFLEIRDIEEEIKKLPKREPRAE